MKKTKIELEDRITMHRRMAEAYRDAYAKKVVKDGASYEEWKIADGAVYMSPYFTAGEDLLLGVMSVSPATYAIMEAKAYSIKFPDWGAVPGKFRCWPTDNGFAMINRFEGHTKDGTKMGFYVYGYIDTNDQGEITRWETHVNGEEYSPFLEVAIGIRGPFLDGHMTYFEALGRVLRESGLSV